MEPDPKYRKGEPSPLQYVKTYINARPGLGIHRAAIDRKRRAMIAIGGTDLYGAYRLLCERAGDLSDLRGLLVDDTGRALTAADLSEWLGKSIKDTRAALRNLCSSRIGVLRRVDFGDAVARVRTRQAMSRQEPEQPGASAGTGQESTIPAPTQGEPNDDGRSDDPPGGGSMNKGPPAAVVGPDGGGVATGDNANPNSNDNGNISASAEINGQAAPDQLACGQTGKKNNDPGHGQGNAKGNAGAERNANGNGNADGERNGDGQQRTDPEAAGRGQTGGNRSAGMGGPAGQGDDEQRTDPEVAGHGLQRLRSADGIAGVTTIPAILRDETGEDLARDIYVRLHLPGHWPGRKRRRNLGAFASVWRKACEQTRCLVELQGGELPAWLIDWGMKQQRNAIRISQIKGKGPDDRARMWQAQAGQSWESISETMIPVSEVRGESDANVEKGGHKA